MNDKIEEKIIKATINLFVQMVIKPFHCAKFLKQPELQQGHFISGSRIRMFYLIEQR